MGITQHVLFKSNTVHAPQLSACLRKYTPTTRLMAQDSRVAIAMCYAKDWSFLLIYKAYELKFSCNVCNMIIIPFLSLIFTVTYLHMLNFSLPPARPLSFSSSSFPLSLQMLIKYLLYFRLIPDLCAKTVYKIQNHQNK